MAARRARRPLRGSSPPVPALAAAPPEPLVALAPEPLLEAPVLLPAVLEPAPIEELPLLAEPLLMLELSLEPVLEPALVPEGAAAPDPGPDSARPALSGSPGVPVAAYAPATAADMHPATNANMSLFIPDLPRFKGYKAPRHDILMHAGVQASAMTVPAGPQ